MTTTTPAATPETPRLTWSARIFSLPVVMGAGLMALLVFFSNPAGARANPSVADPDIWWHLRNASELLHSGHFIRADSWTFTVAGKPWINFEWLAELPYYFAWKWLGISGLYLVMMTLMGSITAGVYLLARMRSGSWKAAFAATFAAILLSTVSMGPRTLLFGWLFLVIELGVLWGLQKGHDFTAGLPLLFLVWINTHGSWFIGFVLMVLFFACGWFGFEYGDVYASRWSPEQKRKMLIVTLISTAVLFLNPYGWRLVVYPLNVAFGQKETIGYVAEWASLNADTVRGKVVLGTFALLAILQWMRPRRWSLQDLVFGLIGIYGAVTYLRFLFLAAILVTPLLAISLSGTLGRTSVPTRGERWVNALGVLALLVFIVIRIPGRQELQAGIAQEFPEQAIPYVGSLAGRGNLFNDFDWGGYLEWNAPQVKEFADSRVDIFVHHGVLRDYLKATHLDGTYAILNQYRIRYALLAKDMPMVYLLERSAGWKKTYSDGQAVVFEREP